jgi:hypothetical protein
LVGAGRSMRRRGAIGLEGDRFKADRCTVPLRKCKLWLKVKNPKAPGMLRFKE